MLNVSTYSRKDLTDEFRSKIWLFHISHSTNCLPECWVAYTTDKKCYDVCYVSLHYRPFWEGMLGHNADGKTYIEEKGWKRYHLGNDVNEIVLVRPDHIAQVEKLYMKNGIIDIWSLGLLGEDGIFYNWEETEE